MPESYSPQEAAIMAGVPLAAIQKAITARRIPARFGGAVKRRELNETALLAFALVEALPAELHLSPGAAYELLQSALTEPDELTIGNLVRIDAGRALAGVRRRLRLYEHSRRMIVSDPEIMGGTPTIKGTRITAQTLLGRIEGGDSVESIVADYPMLDAEMIEAAVLYAKANPPRGRPPGKLWRRAS
jgi:uncharacterized protein (DUF433 family)